MPLLVRPGCSFSLTRDKTRDKRDYCREKEVNDRRSQMVGDSSLRYPPRVSPGIYRNKTARDSILEEVPEEKYPTTRFTGKFGDETIKPDTVKLDISQRRFRLTRRRKRRRSETQISADVSEVKFQDLLEFETVAVNFHLASAGFQGLLSNFSTPCRGQ